MSSLNDVDCAVPNCRFDYKTAFRSPKNPYVLKHWKSALGVSEDKIGDGPFFVCEHHFEDKYLKTTRFALSLDAVPTLFMDHFESEDDKVCQCCLMNFNTFEGMKKAKEFYSITDKFKDIFMKLIELPLPSGIVCISCHDKINKFDIFRKNIEKVQNTRKSLLVPKSIRTYDRSSKRKNVVEPKEMTVEQPEEIKVEPKETSSNEPTQIILDSDDEITIKEEVIEEVNLYGCIQMTDIASTSENQPTDDTSEVSSIKSESHDGATVKDEPMDVPSVSDTPIDPLTIKDEDQDVPTVNEKYQDVLTIKDEPQEALTIAEDHQAVLSDYEISDSHSNYTSVTITLPIIGRKTGRIKRFSPYTSSQPKIFGGYHENDHNVGVHPGQQIKCQYCVEKFPSREALIRHIKSDHTFKCPFCPATFQYEITFLHHKTQEHKKNSTPRPTEVGRNPVNYKFICSTCNLKFSSKESLSSHTRLKHNLSDVLDDSEDDSPDVDDLDLITLPRSSSTASSSIRTYKNNSDRQKMK